MVIDSNTKIAAILKHRAEALDAIISINPCFEKLRNPILRKLMAGRTTLAMASKIGGCNVSDFFQKLQPLGFQPKDAEIKQKPKASGPLPDFMKNLDESKLHVLDVRPVLASGRDPLNIIMTSINSIGAGQVMKIINTFEPTPLILLLGKKGFRSYTEKVNDQLVETYFFKATEENVPEQAVVHNSDDFSNVLHRFENKLKEIDVRKLEMPLPMINILEALEQLPADHALFVHHKRVPVYLLPELTEKGFEFRIRQTGESEVNLLIFR